MTNNKEAGAEQTASIAVAVVLSGCEEGPESSFFLCPSNINCHSEGSETTDSSGMSDAVGD